MVYYTFDRYSDIHIVIVTLTLTPMPINAASTPPAIVANPPAMTACSSLRVIVGRKGLTKIGASVCQKVKQTVLTRYINDALIQPHMKTENI